MSAQHAEFDFRRPVDIDEIGPDEVTFDLVAGAEERRSLARRIGLLSLDRLTATAWVKRTDSGMAVSVRVNFAADVVQSCVVTLDPVPAHIEESFALVYAPEAESPAQGDDVVLSLDLGDPPEPLSDGRFDLGEAVVEHMVLALDPYPRKPGASLGDALAQGGLDREGEDGGPFAVLRRLKKKA